MTRRSSTILLASALLVVALCTASVSGASSSATAGFKFGVILPTSATDLNWSQTMAAASRDTAKQLGVSLTFLYERIRAKAIPTVNLGTDAKKKLRIRDDDLQQFIAERTTPAVKDVA